MMRISRQFLAVALLATLAACVPEPAPQTDTAEMRLPMTTSSEEAIADFLKGVRASDMGRFLEANEHFRAAAKADPEFALAYFGVAGSATSVEEFAEYLELAGEKAAKASEAERTWIESAQMGFANDLEGQLEKADMLVELAPDSPRAWLQLASSQASLGRHEEARVSATKAAELSPEFVPAYTQLGNSYLFNEPRDFGKAEEYLQKVAELEPEEQQSHDLLGDVYRAQGQLDKAHAAYTRAAELDPDNGSPLQQRGHVNSFLGNYDEARADYQAAMDLSNDEQAASFAIWKALVSVHAGDPEGAIGELEELTAAIDTMVIPEPRGYKVNALINIGTIATHHGMTELAQKALEQCRTLMMEQAEEVGTDEFRRGQQAQLAYFDGMLAARTGDYAAASASAEEIMTILEPDANPRKNEPAHEILGLVSLRQGNYDEAIKHYRQTDPADIYARYHLGLAYEGAGNMEEAGRIFDEVASYNFNFAGYALIRADVIDKAAS